MTSPDTSLTAIAGSCDCHMHILYPTEHLPVAPGKKAFPVATVADYQAVAKRLGIERCIMTQTPSYGTDNRWMLEAITEFGPGARGTAAVPASVDSLELDRLTKAGIRGAALHMRQGGPFEWSEVPGIAHRVMDAGWHLHIQLDGLELPDRADDLLALPNVLVIDHIGKFSKPTGIDSPGFKALLRLVDSGRCYVKLSAPYESAWSEPPYMEHSGGLAAALIKAAPERMIWASNWPHVGEPDPAKKPNDAMLLNTLMHWTDSAENRRKILSENPARLYGFDG